MDVKGDLKERLAFAFHFAGSTQPEPDDVSYRDWGLNRNLANN